jgi:hypothetical protein
LALQDRKIDIEKGIPYQPPFNPIYLGETEHHDPLYGWRMQFGKEL